MKLLTHCITAAGAIILIWVQNEPFRVGHRSVIIAKKENLGTTTVLAKETSVITVTEH
jgi:hypothetical protein